MSKYLIKFMKQFCIDKRFNLQGNSVNASILLALPPIILSRILLYVRFTYKLQK